MAVDRRKAVEKERRLSCSHEFFGYQRRPPTARRGRGMARRGELGGGDVEGASGRAGGGHAGV